MRFKNTKIGDTLMINRSLYKVKDIYRFHIKTENLLTKQIECFTFGDLVTIGKESPFPDGYKL